MITKKQIRELRLENLKKQLNKMDFTTGEVDLEGVVFNIGVLLLEHIKDSEL